MMTQDQAVGLTCGRGPTPTFFRLFLPYVYKRVSSTKHRHAFLPLNRDYMPLGVRREGAIDYERVEATHAVYFARDPVRLEGIWWNPRDDMLWLYDDSPASRVDYFPRLESLMKRQMEMVSA